MREIKLLLTPTHLFPIDVGLIYTGASFRDVDDRIRPRVSVESTAVLIEMESQRVNSQSNPKKKLDFQFMHTYAHIGAAHTCTQIA